MKSSQISKIKLERLDSYTLPSKDIKLDTVDNINEIETSKKVTPKERSTNMTKESIKPGIGLDVGTGFLVGASYDANEDIRYLSIRDCFISIEKANFNPKILSPDVKYLEFNDKIFLVGDAALDFAKYKNSAPQRPLAHGIVNPKERASAPILRELFGYVLKQYIKKPNEKVVFSIPGKQISNEKFDTNFHTQSIQGLCRSFKLDAIPLNEAYAVAIAELDRVDGVSALSFSFGAGLVNACLTYQGLNLFEFSVDKSGDYIDSRASAATGESEALICSIKEKKLDLSMDEWEVSPEERALIYEYRWVIQNTLNQVKAAFTNSSSVRVLDSIPIIISGGTSLPKGFVNLFKKEIESTKLPFDVSEVLHAKNPLKSVAKGCLLYANSLEEE